MIFTFTVSVEVERESGKFISRDEISSEIDAALADASPGEIYVDESTYTVVDWAVDEVPQPSKKRSAH